MSETEKPGKMEKLLGEPFGMEYQEDVLKTRRNLLLAAGASIAIFAARLEIQTAPESGVVAPFVGVAMKGVTQEVLLWCLFLSTFYLLVHFFWASLDAIQEYRLRRSGVRVNFQTGSRFSTEGIDAPIHPRQATLYSWWLQEAGRFDDLPDQLSRHSEALDHAISALDALHKKYNDPAAKNLSNAMQAASQAQVACNDLSRKVELAVQVLQSERIPVSLKRFDDAFRGRAFSQNLRWLILEFGVPFLLGVTGVGCVALRLFF